MFKLLDYDNINLEIDLNQSSDKVILIFLQKRKFENTEIQKQFCENSLITSQEIENGEKCK